MSGKIVYAYVVADLLHVGHVLALENAKEFAEKDGKLIVGVLTDEATMEKKLKPVMPFSERMRVIKALKCVDLVVAQDTYSPIKNILTIKPDILMESDSHTEEDLKQTQKAADYVNCEIKMLPYYPERCSTKIKEMVKGPDNPTLNKVFAEREDEK